MADAKAQSTWLPLLDIPQGGGMGYAYMEAGTTLLFFEAAFIWILEPSAITTLLFGGAVLAYLLYPKMYGLQPKLISRAFWVARSLISAFSGAFVLLWVLGVFGIVHDALSTSNFDAWFIYVQVAFAVSIGLVALFFSDAWDNPPFASPRIKRPAYWSAGLLFVSGVSFLVLHSFLLIDKLVKWENIDLLSRNLIFHVYLPATMLGITLMVFGFWALFIAALNFLEEWIINKRQ